MITVQFPKCKCIRLSPYFYLLLAFPFLIANAGTITSTWLGGSGNWGDSAKWDSTLFPDNNVSDDYNAIVNTGSVTVDVNVTIEDLTFGGGTITGGFDVTANDQSSWTSGTMSGTGKTAISAGGTLTINGGSIKNLTQRTLENAGTVTWSVGDIHNRSGATIDNLAGALFNAQGDNVADYIAGLPVPEINNAGTFRKSIGTGTTTIDVYLNNTGDVEVQTGTLALTRGGTSSGNFDTLTGTAVEFTGGVHNFETGANFTGAGVSRLDGATINVNGATTAVNFDVISGTLNGAGELTVTDGNTSNWTGGTMAGTGKTTVAATGAMTISGTGIKNLTQRTLENAGTVTWTDGDIHTRSGATIENLGAGIFDAQGNNVLDYINGLPVPSFNNAGTFRKSVGTGTTTIDVVFNNTGTVNVTSGTLDITRGGNGSGTFNAVSGSTIDFTTITYNLDTGASFTGAGAGRIVGGTVSVNGSATAVNFDIVSGSLIGAGELTITGGNTSNWTGGTMSGTGKTTVATTGVMNIGSASNKTITQRTLENAGTINWTDGLIFANTGATIDNLASGLFDAQGDDRIDHSSGLVPKFDNAGTFRKSAGTGNTIVDIALNNTGSVDVQTGTLELSGGGVSTGNFHAVAGSTIDFTNSVHTLETGASFTGAGAGRVDGGTVTVNGAATAVNFDIISGTLNGVGELTITGGNTSNWTGGTMSGTGKTTVASTGVMNIGSASNKTITQRTLENAGIINWTGGVIFANTGATIDNLADGLFEAQGDDRIDHSSGTVPKFDNAGTFRKSAGSGITIVDIAFNNSGTVDVQTGTVEFSSGGVSSGNFNAVSGSTIDFDGGVHTLNSGANFTGAGAGRVIGGTVTVSGSTTAVNFDVVSGTLNGVGELTITGGTASNWTGGTMSGTGKTTVASTGVMNIDGAANKNLTQRTLENAGTVNWIDGIILANTGATINNLAGGLFDAQNDDRLDHNSGTAPNFVNAGTFRKSGGLGNTTVDIAFDNTGVVDVQSGTLRFSSGDLMTSGTVSIDAATTLNATNRYKQTGGTTVLNGAGSSLIGGTAVEFQGGTLTGSGDVTGSTTFSSAATINPGFSPGIINFMDDTEFDGLIEIGIGGTFVNGMAPDIGNVNTGIDPLLIQYDQINIFDQATLINGLTINISADGGGYNPLDGDFFDIMTADMFFDQGATLITPTTDLSFINFTVIGGMPFDQFFYAPSIVHLTDPLFGSPDRYTLRLVAKGESLPGSVVPEPSTWVLLMSGLGIILARRRHRK